MGPCDHIPTGRSGDLPYLKVADNLIRQAACQLKGLDSGPVPALCPEEFALGFLEKGRGARAGRHDGVDDVMDGRYAHVVPIMLLFVNSALM
jgi:hypothetical protein